MNVKPPKLQSGILQLAMNGYKLCEVGVCWVGAGSLVAQNNKKTPPPPPPLPAQQQNTYLSLMDERLNETLWF